MDFRIFSSSPSLSPSGEGGYQLIVGQQLNNRKRAGSTVTDKEEILARQRHNRAKKIVRRGDTRWRCNVIEALEGRMKLNSL